MQTTPGSTPEQLRLFPEPAPTPPMDGMDHLSFWLEEQYQPCSILASNLKQQVREELDTTRLSKKRILFSELDAEPLALETNVKHRLRRQRLHSGWEVDISLVRTEGPHSYMGVTLHGELFVPLVQFIGENSGSIPRGSSFIDDDYMERCDIIRFGQAYFTGARDFGSTRDMQDAYLAIVRDNPDELAGSIMSSIMNKSGELVLPPEVLIAESDMEDLYFDYHDGTNQLVHDFVRGIVADYDIEDEQLIKSVSDDFMSELFQTRHDDVMRIVIDQLQAARHSDYIPHSPDKPFHLSKKGNFIYSSFADVDSLFELLGDITIPRKKFMSVDPGTGIRDVEYTAPKDEQILDTIVFREKDWDGSCYSYDRELDEDQLSLPLTRNSLAIYVIKQQDGTIRYDVCATNPTLLEYIYEHDVDGFMREWNRVSYKDNKPHFKQLEFKDVGFPPKKFSPFELMLQMAEATAIPN